MLSSQHAWPQVGGKNEEPNCFRRNKYRVMGGLLNIGYGEVTKFHSDDIHWHV